MSLVPELPDLIRRMVVDRTLRAGVDPATAASLTGHSVVVMLRLYRQVAEAHREAAVAKAAFPPAACGEADARGGA